MPKMTEATEKCKSTDEKIKPKKSKSEKKESFVVAATDKTFGSVVASSKLPVFVEFYAPWCGHCKNFAPEYEKAARKMESTALFVKIDATTESALAKAYKISGYPTITYSANPVKSGKKGYDIDLEKYSGGRTSSDLISKAKYLLKKNSAVKEKTDAQIEAILKKMEGRAVVFANSKRAHSHIIDAVSIYFEDVEKTAFFKTDVKSKNVKDLLKMGEKKMAIIDSAKEGKIGVYKYKGVFEFNDLTRDLEGLFKGIKESIDKSF
ncbi:Protein disulfide isomerase [Bonamia ostreae]|uniref:Protein disulfide isomerase n=1 Tax=Bonamia ostreae TaxID=126728 RepID=A0ABV2AIL9_9EUKA